MCNAYYITITAGMRQAFFDKFEVSFIFLKKRLDIVLFLYFYHLIYISALFYCYFFIIIIVYSIFSYKIKITTSKRKHLSSNNIAYNFNCAAMVFVNIKECSFIIHFFLIKIPAISDSIYFYNLHTRIYDTRFIDKKLSSTKKLSAYKT